MPGHPLIITPCCPANYKVTPCYEPAPTPCVLCPNTLTPKWITVELEGIVVPVGTCCDRSNVFNTWSSKITACDEVNGTYVVPFQLGSPYCEWELTTSKQITRSIWGNATCSGPAAGTATDDIHLYLAYYHASGVPRFDFRVMSLGVGINLFQGRLSGRSIDECPTLPAFTNTATAACGAGVFGFADGYDGTATLIPGDVYGPNLRCPGGDPIYTNTDLSSVLGKVIVMEEDDGEGGVQETCWQVELNDTANRNQGWISWTECCDTCANCCDEDYDCEAEGDCA